MSDTVKLPPIPVFNLSRIFSLRDKLLDDVLFGDLGLEISDGALQVFAARIAKAIKLDSSNHPALIDSLRPLLGQVLSVEKARDLCWRLAGNLERLRAGLPVPPWIRQTELEWVPVQIRSSRFHIRRFEGQTRGEVGRLYRFRILSGTPCPAVIERFWSSRMISFFSSRLGFSRPRHGKLVKKDDQELVGMRLLALAEPDLSSRLPLLRKFHCPGAFLKRNRALLKMRRRIGFACPMEYTHECFLCPEGTQTCPAAVHPSDYEAKPCSGCGQEAYFDTDASYPANYCVDCQSRLDSGLSLVHQPSPHRRVVS